MTASHAGTVPLTIVPNATGRKHLTRNRSTHVLVAVTFTPPGGQPSTRTITITWR